MSLALLFSGQGGQHASMLPWLEAASGGEAALHFLTQRFGAGWRARLAEPGWATAGVNAQPLLTATAIAAWRALADHLPPPAVVAGYSVGELPAFAVAGVIDDDDALRLSIARAEAMDRAAAQTLDGRPGGLLSVTGLPRARVVEPLADLGLHLAIRIDVDQHLVGGASASLAIAEARFEAEGARCRQVAVAVPSHTPFMAPAAAALKDLFANISFARPRCPIVCNATGSALRMPDALREALAAQVAQTVAWDDCLEAVHERGVGCVLEIGPGAALARMWNARFPDVPARSVDEFSTWQAIAGWVAKTL